MLVGSGAISSENGREAVTPSRSACSMIAVVGMAKGSVLY